MALDPSIILSGQPVNILGAMASGNALAEQTMGLQRQNAVNALYRDQGAGILNGDPGALNALAGYDPAAALGVRQTQQDMGFSAEKMQMLRDEAQRAVQTHAANLSQAEREAEAAKIERAATAGMAAQTPEQWDALMQQFGATDLVGQFANKQAIAFSYMSMADALKAVTPPDPADEYGRYVQETKAAGQTPLDRIGYEQAKKGNGFSVTSPDGTTIQMGGAAKPFTEGQSKDNVFATRAKGALALLDPKADSLTSRKDRALDVLPMGIGREFQNPDFQLAEQAGLEFLQAILRKDTGAAITPQETDSYGRVYLPQPGDGPEVLQQKAGARQRAVDALNSGMSAAQMLAVELALTKDGQPPEPTGGELAPDLQSVFDKYRQ